MSQVLITGATGLVGGHLLRMLINEPKVNAIAAPTRRPLGDMPGVFNPHDPQLSDALAQVTDPIDIVFCCLGTTRLHVGGGYRINRAATGRAAYVGSQCDGCQCPLAVFL